MTLLPKIDEYACCGHGDCAAIAPNVFRVDEIAVVTGSGPDDVILEAARACPAMAIDVVDEIAVVTGSGPDDVILEAARGCPAMAIEVVDADTGSAVDL